MVILPVAFMDIRLLFLDGFENIIRLRLSANGMSLFVLVLSRVYARPNKLFILLFF